jgi:pyruvate formate lyase activating enzyme
LDSTGIVFNIMRFSVHDGPGIRTTVFLKGCPLDCRWCHNPEGRSFRPEPMYFEERCRHCGECAAVCPEHAIENVNGAMRSRPDRCRRCGACVEACAAAAREIAGRRASVAEVLSEIERDVVFFDESGGGVTLSGGEPVAQHRFALALLAACRARGIHTAIETCGYAHPDVFRRVAQAADLVLFDVKMADREKHRRYTGVWNDRILANLEGLAAAARPPVVRIPVIPGVNDSDADIAQFTAYLGRIGIRRVDLLPYHAMGSDKHERLGGHAWEADASAPLDMERVSGAFARSGFTVRMGG